MVCAMPRSAARQNELLISLARFKKPHLAAMTKARPTATTIFQAMPLASHRVRAFAVGPSSRSPAN